MQYLNDIYIRNFITIRSVGHYLQSAIEPLPAEAAADSSLQLYHTVLWISILFCGFLYFWEFFSQWKINLLKNRLFQTMESLNIIRNATDSCLIYQLVFISTVNAEYFPAWQSPSESPSDCVKSTMINSMEWIIVNQSELYAEGIMDTTKSHPPSTDRRDANDSRLHCDKQRRLFYDRTIRQHRLFSDSGRTTDAPVKWKR